MRQAAGSGKRRRRTDGPATPPAVGAGPAAGSASTPASFSVFVRCPSSKNACIEARACEEVGEVCQRALEREGFGRLDAYTQVYISCGGRPVAAQATLDAAGVKALCTLHIQPNPAAIAARMSLRDRLMLLPQRLERFPDSANTQIDSVGQALQLALAPLQRTEVDAATVEGLGGAVEALASLALLIDLPDKPAVSALGFLWLDSALTALQRHFWHALHADPAQPEAAGACTLAMLQGLVPLLLYKLGDMFMNKQRVVWAAKMLRSFAAQCKSAGVPAQLECPDVAERLVRCLASSLARVVEATADEAQDVRSGRYSRLWGLETWQAQLDATVDGIRSLAKLLACFKAAGGVCAQGSAPSQQQWDSWLQPVAEQTERLCGQLLGLCQWLEKLPASDNEQLHRTFRWLAKLLGASFVCAEIVRLPSTRKSPDAHISPTCRQHLLNVLSSPVMQMALQDVAGYSVLPRRVLLSPELGDSIPTAAKLYHLGQWSRDLSRRADTAEGQEGEEEHEDAIEPLEVQRGEELLESSYAELLPVRPAHLHRGLQVQFAGEPGHGAGVTREWLTLLAPQIFCPELGLFVRCGANPLAILPSATASVQPNHKEYLRVAGRVMGLALLHGVPLGFHLASAFYKGLAGQRVAMDDLQEADPQLAQSLRSITGAKDPSAFGLTFMLSLDHLGQSVEVPLGDDPALHVTAANSQLYADLAVEHVLSGRIVAELAVVKQGLMDVLKVCPTRLFSLAALNDLLAGSSGSLCAEQWRQHTRCIGWDGWRGPAGAADEMEEDELDDQQEPEVLRWLWLLVGQMREAQRAALLRFWTSLPTLPSGGFAGLPQPLTIVRAEPASQRMPLVGDGRSRPTPASTSWCCPTTLMCWPWQAAWQRRWRMQRGSAWHEQEPRLGATGEQ